MTRPDRILPGDPPALRDPLIAAALAPEQAVLAVITNVIGASYRRPGALMALFADGSSAGGLTNGCIEGDLALHAATCLATGRPAHLRYGTGSPFFDIRLPCGGGLNVALYPRPDAAALHHVAQARARRQFFALCFDAAGGLSLSAPQQTGWHGKTFVIDQPPEPRFVIFGEGPETVIFARLVLASGFAHVVITPSPETHAALQHSGTPVTLQTDLRLDTGQIDARTAVVSFFHDHDRELHILAAALQGPAFYIGAQGSRRVAETRLATLAATGLAASTLARLHSPIGVLHSARDPRTLAAAVLAEALGLAGL